MNFTPHADKHLHMSPEPPEKRVETLEPSVPAPTKMAEPPIPKTPEPKKNLHISSLLAFVFGVLFVSASVAAIIYYSQNKDVRTELAMMKAEQGDLHNDMAMLMEEKEELEEEMNGKMEENSVRNLASTEISFNYPNGWHVSGSRIYDSPDGEADFTYGISPDPIIVISPNEGIHWTVEMHSIASDAAIYAGYGEADWESFETDTLTINGVEATRFRLTASEDMVFTPKHQEVIFLSGDEHRFEIIYSYNEPEEANDPAWLTIRDSIVVK